jgi:hypothetical protein
LPGVFPTEVASLSLSKTLPHAQALGLNIPLTLLSRAEVIE